MNNEAIARAIVYAARQATMINEWGMRWGDIEANTVNILAGCVVPADGKMNSAKDEHAQDTIRRQMASLQRIRAERDAALAEQHAQVTERNEADRKLVKLRAFLERGLANPFQWSDNAIKYLLEETK